MVTTSDSSEPPLAMMRATTSPAWSLPSSVHHTNLSSPSQDTPMTSSKPRNERVSAALATVRFIMSGISSSYP